MNKIRVLIGIQARSNSSRFPNKIFEKIGNKSVLDWVVEKAQKAALHVNRYNKLPIECQVAVLCPEGDNAIVRECRCKVIQGSESDVLSRYVNAQAITDTDYVIRVTSDCPLILDYMITKHINVAVIEGFDYVSNVDESCRTIADGFDCEAISKRALAWLDENAKGSEDREHVSTLLRKVRPAHLQQALVLTKLDTSHMKMSVDTPEDLERIRTYYHSLESKRDAAFRLFSGNVYEL